MTKEVTKNRHIISAFVWHKTRSSFSASASNTAVFEGCFYLLISMSCQNAACMFSLCFVFVHVTASFVELVFHESVKKKEKCDTHISYFRVRYMNIFLDGFDVHSHTHTCLNVHMPHSCPYCAQWINAFLLIHCICIFLAVACDVRVNRNTEIHLISIGVDCIHFLRGDESVLVGNIMQQPIFNF